MRIPSESTYEMRDDDLLVALSHYSSLCGMR